MNPDDAEEKKALQNDIENLERRLRDAKDRLENMEVSNETICRNRNQGFVADRHLNTSETHSFLLLSDSALPLGSFAFSNGLESYLAHHPSTRATIASHFSHFLNLSVASVASTTLPYVLASYRHPSRLEELDNDFDASTPCTVARRASVAQGKALIGVWERAFSSHYHGFTSTEISILASFSTLLRSAPVNLAIELPPSAHLAPLFGIVALVMGLTAYQTAYVFLFNHIKATMSAAVRASVMGPYQAQGVLASKAVHEMVVSALERSWDVETEDAGQNVPVLDLWVGRHELLYSRIFNS